MKKSLAILASLLLITALSYFCFLDKVKKIQNHILSDVQNAYHIAGIDWIKPRLEGEGIYATRELIVEGDAPNKEELQKADKIALFNYGISSMQKKFNVNSTEDKKEIQSIKTANKIPEGIENKLKKKITNINRQSSKESFSTIKVNKDKNGLVSIKGLVPNLKIQNKIISHAKYLFKDKLNSELTVGDSENQIDTNSAILALDELKLLDRGSFTLKNRELSFKGEVNKTNIKDRVLAELKNQLPKSIHLQTDILSQKSKAKNDKISTPIKTKIANNSNKKEKTNDKTLSCQENVNRFVRKNRIHFKYNSDKINKNSFKILDELVTILNSCKDKAIDGIVVSGHTDNSGNSLYNLKLSQKRADAIKEYLNKDGLKTKIVSIGYGSKMPIASNKTKEGRAKNRRIEFKVADKKSLDLIKDKLKNRSIKKVENKKVAKDIKNQNSLSIANCQNLLDKSINSKKIYFSLDKSKIDKEGLPIAKRLVKILKRCKNAKLTIKSYTDSIGKKEDNLKISQKKADTIKRYLINHGINKDKIEAIGYGERDPIADNTTTSGRAKNRRVKFYIKEIK